MGIPGERTALPWYWCFPELIIEPRSGTRGIRSVIWSSAEASDIWRFPPSAGFAAIPRLPELERPRASIHFHIGSPAAAKTEIRGVHDSALADACAPIDHLIADAGMQPNPFPCPARSTSCPTMIPSPFLTMFGHLVFFSEWSLTYFSWVLSCGLAPCQVLLNTIVSDEHSRLDFAFQREIIDRFMKLREFMHRVDLAAGNVAAVI